MHASGSTRSSSTLLAITLLAASGCATGKTFVMQPPAEKRVAASARIVEDASTVEVPEDHRDLFRTALRTYLHGEQGFADGPDLTIRWRFVQYNKGNQALRYFAGFGAGKGSLAVQAKFYDPTGNELATIQSEGEISVGVFGGSFDAAIEKCADEIAVYAKTNFR